MNGKNWFVNRQGECQLLDVIQHPELAVYSHSAPQVNRLNGDPLAYGHGRSPQPESLSAPYRLYRFLTDLEDVLAHVSDDQLRLQLICPLVRKLLDSSAWLHFTPLEPNPETGWEILTLYDEPFFPLTVQLVAWTPGSCSPIHNHGSWGLVALLNGQETHQFWQRSPTTTFPDQISWVGDRHVSAGDLICFMPDAIHQVRAIGDQPAISFNLYGETNYSQRFEFDTRTHTARIF